MDERVELTISEKYRKCINSVNMRKNGCDPNYLNYFEFEEPLLGLLGSHPIFLRKKALHLRSCRRGMYHSSNYSVSSQKIG